MDNSNLLKIEHRDDFLLIESDYTDRTVPNFLIISDTKNLIHNFLSYLPVFPLDCLTHNF